MGNRTDILDNLALNQKDQILKHLALLLKSNDSLNLTRIKTQEESMLLHVEDSLAGLPEIKAAPEGLYGDLGSGNGYPGIPIAIASGRKTILIESIKKKAAALKEIVEALELSSQIKVYAERIEDVFIKEENCFAVLTARALSSLPSLMELASPLLQDGGHLVCYKSQLPNEELENAYKVEEKLGLKVISNTHYFLSDNETERTLITFQKKSNPKVSLPRRPGMAQKRPYCH